MPLSVRVLQAPSPPVASIAVPPPVLREPPVGRLRVTWQDPEGTEYELMGPHGLTGWLTRPEIAGWGANPATIVTDPLARGGVSIRHVRAEPRRLTWPLHIYGDTHMQFIERYRRLMRAFTLTKSRGAGVLTVYRPDGTARSIEAYLEDGWGGEPGENVRYANPTLTLLCPDGFWRDTEPRVSRREYNSGFIPYLAPYPTVNSSRVLGDSTVDNPGDVNTWPSWTLTGPATQFTATNATTGESFTLTYGLGAGQKATITVTPNRALVRGPAGQNIVGSLNWPSSVLWALLPGTNQVNFSVNGSGAGTAVELSYYPRYETA